MRPTGRAPKRSHPYVGHTARAMVTDAPDGSPAKAVRSRAAMASLGVVLDVAACSMDFKALGVEIHLTMSAAGHLTLISLDSHAIANAPVVPLEVVAAAHASPVPILVPSALKGKEPATRTQPSKKDVPAEWEGETAGPDVLADVVPWSVPGWPKWRGLAAGSSRAPPVPALRAFVLAAILTSDTPVLHQKAFELHTHYGSLSAARLNELPQTAGAQDDKVFEAATAAVDGCDACKRTAPRPNLPLVAVPRALQSNDTVAVDLAQVAPAGIFLHMVELGTRVSKAVALSNKEPNTVARVLLAGWFVHHCAPRALPADPGAEFNNAVWRLVSERQNVAVLSTAAQAHWSNGVLEQHNVTLKTIVATEALEHIHVSLQELLYLACHA